MVRQCAVKGCKSEHYAGCGISFFSLPSDESLKKQWLDFLNKDSLRDSAAICSLHFKREDYTVHLSKSILKKTAIPSIHPGVNRPKKYITVSNFEIGSASPKPEEESTDEASVNTIRISGPPRCILVNDPSPTTYEPPSPIFKESVSPEPDMYISNEEPFEQTSIVNRPSRILEINPLPKISDNSPFKQIKLLNEKQEKMQREIRSLKRCLKRRDQKIKKYEELLNFIKEHGYDPDELES